MRNDFAWTPLQRNGLEERNLPLAQRLLEQVNKALITAKRDATEVQMGVIWLYGKRQFEV